MRDKQGIKCAFKVDIKLLITSCYRMQSRVLSSLLYGSDKNNIFSCQVQIIQNCNLNGIQIDSIDTFLQIGS